MQNTSAIGSVNEDLHTEFTITMYSFALLRSDGISVTDRIGAFPMGQMPRGSPGTFSTLRRHLNDLASFRLGSRNPRCYLRHTHLPQLMQSQADDQQTFQSV